MESNAAYLRKLDIGAGVAESDRELIKHFYRTNLFADFLHGRHDILLGDKGAGKTAIYKYTRESKQSFNDREYVHIVNGFSESGSTLFQRFSDIRMNESKFRTAWKLFFFGIAGNALLDSARLDVDSGRAKLRTLLKRQNLRQESGPVSDIFAKVGRIMERRVNLKGSGGGVALEVDLAEASSRKTKVAPSGDAAEGLAAINDLLERRNEHVWIMLDRLDEAFLGAPELEIIALKALLRSYLDLKEFDRIKLKIFARKDLIRKISTGGFVNATHLQPSKVEILWRPEDLFDMLCWRIKSNKNLLLSRNIDVRSKNEDVFNHLFCAFVGSGNEKVPTWDWILKRLEDGNGTRSPRNLIDLVNKAKERQIRKEERLSKRAIRPHHLIESDSLNDSFEDLSIMRVDDTLIAEYPELAPVIETFREGKATWDTQSIGLHLNVEGDELAVVIDKLLAIGFFAPFGKAKYRIPLLYRPGMNIKNGAN
jgi:hypothetical protein